MPTTFLSLPRELRDQIYEYILVSPTGLIEPILVRHPTKSKSKRSHQQQSESKRYNQSLTHHGQFLLHIKPLTPPRACQLDSQPVTSQRTSLSILRVCRQITDETQSMFWNRNTLYFSSFFSSSESIRTRIGLQKTLKQMGQTSSRMIQRITLRMSDPEEMSYRDLGKALYKLESRARHGQFQKLTLLWESVDFAQLIRLHRSHFSPTFDEFEQQLEIGKELGRFERVIEISEAAFKYFESRTNTNANYRSQRIVMKLNRAFGGKLFLGGDLIMENGTLLGDVIDGYLHLQV